MARKSDGERNREQRQRQQAIREKQKAQKRPHRDDVARLALYWLISRAHEKGQKEELEKFHDKIVKMLVEQGFDEHASDEVLDDLIRKYKPGSLPFRRKVHLLHPNGGDQDD